MLSEEVADLLLNGNGPVLIVLSSDLDVLRGAPVNFKDVLSVLALNERILIRGQKYRGNLYLLYLWVN